MDKQPRLHAAQPQRSEIMQRQNRLAAEARRRMLGHNQDPDIISFVGHRRQHCHGLGVGLGTLTWNESCSSWTATSTAFNETSRGTVNETGAKLSNPRTPAAIN